MILPFGCDNAYKFEEKVFIFRLFYFLSFR